MLGVTTYLGLRHRRNAASTTRDGARAPRLRSCQTSRLEEKQDMATFLSNQERLGTLEAWFMSLALEPMEVRAERAVNLWHTEDNFCHNVE